MGRWLFSILQEHSVSKRRNTLNSVAPNSVITITRAPGNIFHAVSAYCTHSGCITDKYLGDDTNAIRAFGLDVVTELCERLLKGGAPGLHFYAMNQSALTTEICRRLGLSR